MEGCDHHRSGKAGWYNIIETNNDEMISPMKGFEKKQR